MFEIMLYLQYTFKTVVCNVVGSMSVQRNRLSSTVAIKLFALPRVVVIF